MYNAAPTVGRRSYGSHGQRPIGLRHIQKPFGLGAAMATAEAPSVSPDFMDVGATTWDVVGLRSHGVGLGTSGLLSVPYRSEV